jgi:hypothetical protein
MTFSETVTWSFKWENYLNSFSNKTVTISLDRQQINGLNVIPFVFFNNTIIVQVRYIIIEAKEVARNGYNGFLFPHSYSGDGLGAMHLDLHLSTHAEKETRSTVSYACIYICKYIFLYDSLFTSFH